MRIDMFEKLMKQRDAAFDAGIENIDFIESELKKLTRSMKSDLGHALLVANVINHYREVSFFQGFEMNEKLLMKARDLLESAVANGGWDEKDRGIILYSLGLSYIPFIRGNNQEVFNYLEEHQLFNLYFNGHRKAFSYFEGPGSLDFLEDDLKSECYKVWKRYASANHLSDLIFNMFLNSDVDFEEIASLNEKYIEKIEAEGLADEWKQK